MTLETCRDIAAGEEVTCDYGTSTGDDWKLLELQQRYGNHWIPALLKRQHAPRQ